MSDPNLGHLITTAQSRDAVHIAICPVMATEKLLPGDCIGFTRPGETTLVAKINQPIGVVDPFLKQAVNASEVFWMFLFPKTVTGLRHEWDHPAFEQRIEDNWDCQGC